MEIELVPAQVLSDAVAAIARGGDGVKEGLASLLEARLTYKESSDATGGKDCAQVLCAGLRRLHDDPYLALGVPVDVQDTEIKKSYRKLALKYHPDKNKATSSLFQAIQGAHDTLTNPEARSAYDIRRQKQHEALEKLRKQNARGPATASPTAASAAQSPRQPSSKPASPGATPASAHSGGGGRAAGAAAGGGAAPQPARTGGGGAAAAAQAAAAANAASSANAKQAAFQKKFYDEFRRTQKWQAAAGASGAGHRSKAAAAASADPAKGGHTAGAAGVAAGAGSAGATREKAPQAPPRPRLRSAARSESTVTLEWSCGNLPVTTAYELQWRQRGRTASDWVTSPTLIVGTRCRKKNLEQCTCYEFRVRAASAWGWSAYSDPVMVVTLAGTAGPAGAPGSPGGAAAAAAAADKASAAAATAAAAAATGKASPPAASGGGAAAGGEGRSKGASESGPGGKTSSWYWRRMSHAAAASHKGDAASARSAGAAVKEKERRQTHHQGSPVAAGGAAAAGGKGEGWQCVVCKRANDAASNTCWVCFTSRYYKAENLGRISVAGDTAPTAAAAAAAAAAGAPAEGGGKQQQDAFPGRSSPAPDNSKGKEGSGAGAAAAAAAPAAAQAATGKAAEGKKAGAEEGKDGIRVTGHVPSIRVYCDGAPVPRADTDGIHVSGRSAGSGGDRDGVWAFSDDDVDQPSVARSSDGSSDDEEDDDWSYTEENWAKDGGGGGGAGSGHERRGTAEAAHYFLNTSVTKRHKVRSEPTREGAVVGYVVAGRSLEVLAEVGDWLKVNWHEATGADTAASGTGWCTMRVGTRVFVMKEVRIDEGGTSNAGSPRTSSPTGADAAAAAAVAAAGEVAVAAAAVRAGETAEVTEGEAECWYELRDGDGATYYFNSGTGESQWELPPWLDEIDPESGATYYVSSITGEATWDKPADFVQVVRENPYYTTAETEFVKSVLSPKRSKGACSFTQHLHRTSQRSLAKGSNLSSSMYRMQAAMAQQHVSVPLAEGDEKADTTPRCEVDYD